MELRHLRYFVAVAEEQSFTRAARRLGMAQPPLSQQIAKLERELAVRLLERSPRGVRLTRAGSTLLAEARTLLTRADETERIVRRVGAGERGAVRIGSIASAFSGILVPGLREFRSQHPEVLPLVYELEATPQLEALAHRTIDISFLRTSGPHTGVDLWPLATERLVAALPHDHPAVPASGRAHVDLSVLANEPFVLFPRVSAPEAFDVIVGACRSAGFTPDVVYEAPNDHALVSLVAAGLAVSLVPHSTSNLRLPGVVYRTVSPACTAAPLAVALPSDAPTEPALQLLQVVRGFEVP